jgi:hypothetical protein
LLPARPRRSPFTGVVQRLQNVNARPGAGFAPTLAAFLLACATALSLAVWQYQARQTQYVVLGAPQDADVVRGFHGPERSAYYAGRTFRWTEPNRAQLRFWGPAPAHPAILSLWMSVPAQPQSLTVQTAQRVLAELTL